MKKKLLAMVLSCALVITMMPQIAKAAAKQIWIDNVDIVADDDHTLVCGDGTVVYDEATETLTLNNATISKKHAGNACVFETNNEVKNLTIKLIGENKINPDFYLSCGILAECNLKIQGSNTDTLDINVDSCGIETGALTIDGAKVNITTNRASGITVSRGTLLDKQDRCLAIKNHANLTVRSGQKGIYSTDTLTIQNSVVDIVTNTKSAIAGIGGVMIEASKISAISNGEWISDDTDQAGNAIYSPESITIKDCSDDVTLKS